MTRRCISGLITLAAMIFVAGQALALETLAGEPETDDRMEATRQQVAPSEEPLAAGRVVAVDRAASRITLEFRPIPQLFLEGGIRIFRVADPALLKGVGAGDKVRFEVELNDRTYTVTRIKHSN